MNFIKINMDNYLCVLELVKHQNIDFGIKGISDKSLVQNVELPISYIQFLEQAGDTPIFREFATRDRDFLYLKELYNIRNRETNDVANHLPFMDAQGSNFALLDLSEDRDNPPVYYFMEGDELGTGDLIKVSTSFTEYLLYVLIRDIRLFL